jgi:hypothetical protein
MRRPTAIVTLLLTLTAATAQAQADSAKTKPASDSAKAPVTMGSATAGAAAFVGKWTGSIESPQGQMPVNAELKQDGTGFVGTISGLEGNVPLREITIKGDTVIAGATMSAQGMSIEVWYNFIRSGETLSGSASANFNGQSMSFPLTLTRVKP